MNFQIGDRIELIDMQNDPNPIPHGSTGTITSINELPSFNETQIGVGQRTHTHGTSPTRQNQKNLSESERLDHTPAWWKRYNHYETGFSISRV